MPMLYDVECADRETATPYKIHVQAMDAAEAMQKASRAHLVAKVALAKEQPGLTPMGSLPEDLAKVHEELRTLTPQVADAETIRLLRETSAHLAALVRAQTQSFQVQEETLRTVKDRTTIGQLAFSVAMGIILSVPIAMLIVFVLTLILAALGASLKNLP